MSEEKKEVKQTENSLTEAFNIIVNASRQFRGTWQDHETIQRALQTLGSVVAQQETNKKEEKK